jgi:hypothetical protein
VSPCALEAYSRERGDIETRPTVHRGVVSLDVAREGVAGLKPAVLIALEEPALALFG